MKTIIKLCAFVAMFASVSVSARCYSVMTYHGANPPYSFENSGKVTGLFADLFESIELHTGLCFEFVTVSVARGQKLFESGKIDIEPGISPSWRADSSNPGIYSLFYAQSREIIISTQPEQIASPEHLYGKVMGRVRGYRYGEFEHHFNHNLNDEKIIVYDNTSEKELLAQLLKRRFDYMMIGDITAAYYRLSLEDEQQFYEVYEVSSLPVAMRLQPHLGQLKLKLDDALSQMAVDGTIAKIYRRYSK